MFDRLIALIRNAVGGCAQYWARTIAVHLLANGVIVPPCKVGDTVYRIWGSGKHGKSVADFVVTKVSQIAPNIWIVRYLKPSKSLTHYLREYQCNFEDFGKTVFLTREEAETALKERERE